MHAIVKRAHRSRKKSSCQVMTYRMRTAPRSIPVMRRGVELGLLAFGEAGDAGGVERVVARQMFPKGHALDARRGRINRLKPDAQLVGMQTPQPAAGRAAVSRATPRIGHARIVFDCPSADIT